MKQEKTNRQVVQMRSLAEKINVLHEVLVREHALGRVPLLPDSLAPVIFDRGTSQYACLYFSGHHLFGSGGRNFFKPRMLAAGYSFYIVKDYRCCWFDLGLMGITSSIDETASWLRKRIAKDQCVAYLSIGFSSGAYASILLGTMLGVKSIIAFAPQNHLNKKVVQSFSYNNPYTPDTFFHNYKFAYPNLAEFLHGCNNLPNIHIVVGAQCESDMFKAKALKDAAPNSVIIHEIDGYNGHNILKHMRDTSQIDAFLATIILNHKKK